MEDNTSTPKDHKYNPFVIILILIGIILIPIVFGQPELWKENPFARQGKPSKKEIDQAIGLITEILNQKAPLIKIENTSIPLPGDSFINNSIKLPNSTIRSSLLVNQELLISNLNPYKFYGLSPKKQIYKHKARRKYRISLQNLDRQDESTQLFPIEQYNPDFGPDVFTALGETLLLCNTLKKYALNKKNINKWSQAIEDVKIKVNAKMPLGLEIGSEADITQFTQFLISLWLARAIPGNVKVFVRGYADTCKSGSENCKINRLDQNYLFREVQLHPFLKNPSQVRNPELYGWGSNIKSMSTSSNIGNYENKHLPNLRARFFKEEIIENLMNDCDNNKFFKDIGILEGRTSNQRDPNMRKVEIYLAIF